MGEREATPTGRRGFLYGPCIWHLRTLICLAGESIMQKKAPPQKIVKATGRDEDRTLHQKMQALRIQLAGDRQASIAFLQRAGILTRAGKLAKAYR